MKILITCHSYYPKKDGVQFVTQYLAEGLVKLGCEVTVFTNHCPDVTNIREERFNGVFIKRFEALTKHAIYYGDKKKYQNEVLNQYSKFDVMVNVCTQCPTTDWLFPILDKINIPKVLYLHSIWDFKFKKEDFSELKKFLGKCWFNFRWGIYYNTHKKEFKKYNIVTQLHEMDYANKYFKNKYDINSIIIENAAEDVFFEKEIDENIILPKKYILNVSNYIKRKNQIRCLELFLNSDVPDDWELILIGSKRNSYYEKVLKRYNEYKKTGGKKQVKLMYDVPRKDVSTYVKKAQLTLMASDWEAFPITLVESLAAGVPYISSNVGIVKFLNGGIVCNNNVEFVYWLNKLSSNETLRKNLGMIGKKEAINSFSVSSKVNQFYKILKELEKVSENYEK